MTNFSLSYQDAIAEAAKIAARCGFGVVERRAYDGRCNALDDFPGSDLCRPFAVDASGKRIDAGKAWELRRKAEGGSAFAILARGNADLAVTMLDKAASASTVHARKRYLAWAMRDLRAAMGYANKGARHMMPALFRAMNKLRAIIAKAGA